MKPNFALSLSFEGIRLLHRVAGGWRSIGDVSFDADDMTAELAMLRKTAASLEPGGVRTKLLIPNDQIKYMTLETPGLSDADRMAEARSALEGATPYAVEDLAFDISTDGAQTHVAAVARETLAEAEAFAAEHRFYPVSFVAQPDSGVFKGEPFFGPTDASSTLLDRDETIEPDDEAVVILGPYVPPAEDTAKEAPLTDLFEQVTTKDEPAATKTPDNIAASGKVDATSAAHAPSDSPAKETGKDDKPVAKANKEQVSAAAATLSPKPDTSAEVAGPKTDLLKKTLVAAKTVPVPTVPDVSKNNITPAVPAPVSAPTGFASRRNAPSPSAGAATRGQDKPTVSAATTVPKSPAPAAPLVPDSRSLSPVPVEKTTAKKLGFLSRRKTPPPSTEASDGPALAAESTGTVLPKATSEAEKMTVFGARKPNDVGGKPRYLGLLLTAALLVFLAGVAAWASVFLDDGISLSRLFAKRDTTATASAPVVMPDPAPVKAEASAAPSIETQSDADSPDPSEERVAALDPSLTDEDGAVLDALRVPELAQPRSLTQQEIEAKYATSGIWAVAPETPSAPAIVSLDDLYMTSIDPVSTANDAVALPTLASFGGDAFDFLPASPAPPGTAFTLDNNGMVVATPDGALNADGVKVIAGRPPVEPPQELIRTTTAPDAPQETQTTQPGLLEFRPVVRPNGLIESNERSNLGGLTRSELASRRPSLRPASIQKAVAAAAAVPEPTAPEVDAAAAAAGASLAAIAAVPPKPVGPVLNDATRYAVQASIRPDTRPRNFARIVKRAQRAKPVPTQVASTAGVAPRTVAPSVPSKASVAKQATVKNAIKLRNINLIGVYGKPSSRRALIRLSNGRYQKVAVGDRLDGGRVSAIGESELRYTRRGRDVVLKMPRG
jgi:hypothetical protein